MASKVSFNNRKRVEGTSIMSNSFPCSSNQHYVFLSVVFLLKAEVCNFLAPVHTHVFEQLRRNEDGLYTAYTLEQKLWLGYTRPINLNQALNTPYIPTTISSQPRAGE